MSGQINLVNPLLAKKDVNFSARSFARAIGLLAAVLLMIIFFAYASLAQLRVQETASAKKRLDALAKLETISQQVAPRQKSRALEDEIRRVELELKEHEAAIAFLNGAKVAHEEAGYSDYMQAFARQIVSGLWLTAFSIDHGTLIIEGRAQSEELVPRYINRLKQEPIMAGFSMDRLEMRLPKPTEGSRAPGYIEFSITSSRATK